MYSASNRPYLNQFTFLVSFELVPDEPLSSVRPLLPGHLQFPRGWPHTTGDTESWGRDLLPRKWEVKSFKYRVTPFHFNLQSECLSKGGGGSQESFIGWSHTIPGHLWKGKLGWGKKKTLLQSIIRFSFCLIPISPFLLLSLWLERLPNLPSSSAWQKCDRIV